MSERQHEIVAHARRVGRVGVEELAARFAVTPQTIRRDLNELCLHGLLSRVHGGAVPAHSVANSDYGQRRALAAPEKRRIGEAAAALIPEHCSLFINIGTTTEQVAQALREHRDLVVITNNINVVNILSGAPAKEIIVAGGVVRPSDGGVVGEATVDFISQFKVDFAVVGASALDEDGSILDYDYREVKVSQAILANARHRLLVADHLKFARSAPVRIGHIGMVDRLITDAAPPEPFAKVCAEHGVAIDVAEEPRAQAFA